jgi:fused signal recognition particle receptor
VITLFGKQEKEASLLDRLKQSVGKTRAQLGARIEELLAGRREISPEVIDRLEAALLSADLGVRTTREVLATLREEAARQKLHDAAELKAALKRRLVELLAPRLSLGVPDSGRHGSPQTGAVSESRTAVPSSDGQPGARSPASPDQSGPERLEKPRVVFIVGVNGTGKTTTIGKLAHRLKQQGRSVLLCAADTFRAAATEQLEAWGTRVGAEVIKQKPGADPAAVVYDALAAARARSTDVVIVDTAGRLHTKSNLMAELEKMKRTAGKAVPGAPHDVLLVLDATTGQNGLAQAREFTSHAGVTGIVLTKLDGTAKGGIVVAIVRELGLPVEFVGTGEKTDDLVPFDPETFVDSLFA